MAHERNRFCIIAGAGVSGLVQATELIRNGVLQPEELEILDRNSNYGGVWNDAIYPGVGCDVFSILYQVSWFRKSDWSSFFPAGNELAAYFRQFADKYELRSCTTFNTNIIEAVWSYEKMVWTVITEDTITQQRTKWTTKILVYAPGTYNRSTTPDISGISSFEGEMWHTYNWPTDADLTGKTVAYIGSGPSAVQILPSIQPSVKSLKVYIRSMTYCLPIPGSWVARSAEWYCTRYFEKEVRDPVLRKKLHPKGHIGDKRPLVSRGFYKVLQQPNVEVITDPITSINESGIIYISLHTPSKNTHNRVDVIIWGTGFKMQGWGTAFKIVGLDGKTLGEHWGGAPRTLYGIGFPNLMFVSGPNSVAPWASIISGIEIQALYNIRVIQEIKARCADGSRFSIMPRTDIEIKYTESLQAELEQLATSLSFGPRNYYVSEQGRNTFFFPFTQLYYRWLVRKVKWENYDIVEQNSIAQQI
ncbi:hypothetical protein OIDMADRAFT_169525 [Oidiodendron maius Zn]|uniref:FAD/NAD(P)-binding domain-containing protein n=1 Tax=Oidiodendron maius (strain Zn) TaxID=913774 RepID=A0A0C3H2G3_OIDMZ|nr:hypothetical protein OIDMADRAFT_169525 [Oidiodendron maius Zn]